MVITVRVVETQKGRLINFHKRLNKTQTLQIIQEINARLGVPKSGWSFVPSIPKEFEGKITEFDVIIFKQKSPSPSIYKQMEEALKKASVI